MAWPKDYLRFVAFGALFSTSAWLLLYSIPCRGPMPPRFPSICAVTLGMALYKAMTLGAIPAGIFVPWFVNRFLEPNSDTNSDTDEDSKDK